MLEGWWFDYRLIDDRFQKKGIPVRFLNNTIFSHHHRFRASNVRLIVAIFRLIIELQFFSDGLLEDLIVFYYIGLEHAVPLFFIPEYMVELSDE